MNILVWVFGGCAMLSLFLSYQQRTRGRLLTCKLFADVFWAAHYFCLGAYGGMVPNFVGIFRELVFRERGKRKWASGFYIPVIFIVFNWGLGIATWQGPLNLLPLVASTFVTISLWLKNPKLTKLISIPVSCAFLIYDIFVLSYIGMVNESFAILSIMISFCKKEKKSMSIFTSDIATEKPELIEEGGDIAESAAVLAVKDQSEEVFALGETYAEDMNTRIYSDFEKPGDGMAHVSTFAEIGDTVYMTYYANTQNDKEDPLFQTARLVYCKKNDPEHKTFLDIQSVGDELSGLRVNMVYDTIFAQKDENTLIVLWTAKVGENYYRLYRNFDMVTKTLGEIGVNRLKLGNITNDFSTTGIVGAFAANDMAHKTMYSDIGIMQKFTTREENGVLYYYTGAYSGDLNMVIKSRDFITWEYVSAPDFINRSKWENATFVIGDKCFYFVRQHDGVPYGFLTVLDLETGKWETPVLVEDCQSRGDFYMWNGNLYLFYAPIDREHIGVLKVNTEDITKSEIRLIADIHGSCFYPFVQSFGEELAMSYTVDRKHIRLSQFDPDKYLF